MNVRVLFLLPMIIVLLCTAGQCAEKGLPRHAQVALWKAQQERENGHVQKACDILATYDEKHPGAKSAIFHLMLGNAYMDLEQEEKACAVYKRGLSQHPHNADIALNLAIAEQTLEEYARAARSFTLAHDLRTTPDPDLLYQAAFCHHLAAENNHVLKVMQQLIPTGYLNDPNRLSLLVQTLVVLSRWKEAENTLLRFLQMQPKQVEYWKLLGQVRFQQKNYQGAASALEVAARIGQPADTDLLTLADLYQYLNAPLKAAHFLEIMQGAKDPSLCRRIAGLYAKAQRHEQTISWLAEAGRQTEDPDIYMEKARLQRRALRQRDAIATLDALLLLKPDYSSAHMLKADCAWECGLWDMAITSLEYAAKDPEYSAVAENALQVIKAARTIDEEQ